MINKQKKKKKIIIYVYYVVFPRYRRPGWMYCLLVLAIFACIAVTCCAVYFGLKAKNDEEEEERTTNPPPKDITGEYHYDYLHLPQHVKMCAFSTSHKICAKSKFIDFPR